MAQSRQRTTRHQSDLRQDTTAERRSTNRGEASTRENERRTHNGSNGENSSDRTLHSSYGGSTRRGSMDERYGRVGFGDRGGQSGEGWTGLMSSMIGFTNSATMFSIQQMQNMYQLFTDSREVLRRLKHSFDSVSQAMNREMDETYRSQVDHMNRAGAEAVNAMSGSSDESTEHGYRQRGDNAGYRTTRTEERVERTH
jgi:hypothetical protein